MSRSSRVHHGYLPQEYEYKKTTTGSAEPGDAIDAERATAITHPCVIGDRTSIIVGAPVLSPFFISNNVVQIHSRLGSDTTLHSRRLGKLYRLQQKKQYFFHLEIRLKSIIASGGEWTQN
jgi:hypothetical protein